jgi:hypothetical protein
MRSKCLKCSRSFTADRYNKHHQKYCTHPKCVQERARERKRKWHSGRRREDPAFCESERKRCREAMALIRARGKQAGEAVSAPPLPESSVSHVLAGLIAQLSNCSDPRLLREEVDRHAARGRLLSGRRPVF